jgi:peroxiredoxin
LTKQIQLAHLGLLLLGLLLLGCGGSDSDVKAGIGQGNRAPDFQLETLDGQKVSLEDYRGKVVLLNFWATWCDPCKDEIPALEAAYRARQADGFVVLGVNFQESAKEIEPFAEKMDMSYPILLDTNGQVMKTFRAVGLPVSLLIDREGVIQVRHTGLLTGTQLAEYLATLLP